MKGGHRPVWEAQADSFFREKGGDGGGDGGGGGGGGGE